MSAALKLYKASQRTELRESGLPADAVCRLVTAEPGSRSIPIRPVDVSRRGLGFIARESLQQGAILWLEVGSSRMRVELAYCNNHLGIDNLYRCGLFLREADGDLAALCFGLGLIDPELNGKT